ncbi:uncharacterized protein B0I36DRAFT_361051 [Microdochium trichocladiopsis]|uniref:Uncharacterized protein n=1 Tax=Microdochium trichocladiopsis TaxID=1682393 RepID=A0A9P8Y9V6_9PEZI|nr:uncharacterized protein B0I36DRAFT_361051 [Microdochium trichocladiopsis]KAH7035719.1 hypothetical protein B0I36DRAFT_361051 [Microdochium trichocladiopsis]
MPLREAAAPVWWIPPAARVFVLHDPELKIYSGEKDEGILYSGFVSAETIKSGPATKSQDNSTPPPIDLMAPKGVVYTGISGDSDHEPVATGIPGWAIGVIAVLGFLLIVYDLMVWYFWIVGESSPFANPHCPLCSWPDEHIASDFDKPFRYGRVFGQAFLFVILVTPVKMLLNRMGARKDCCGGLCTARCLRQKLLVEDMEASTARANAQEKSTKGSGRSV